MASLRTTKAQLDRAAHKPDFDHNVVRHLAQTWVDEQRPRKPAPRMQRGQASTGDKHIRTVDRPGAATKKIDLRSFATLHVLTAAEKFRNIYRMAVGVNIDEILRAITARGAGTEEIRKALETLQPPELESGSHRLQVDPAQKKLAFQLVPQQLAP